VFQGSLAVAIIMIDGSEKPNRELGFELQSSHVIENRNNIFKSNFKEMQTQPDMCSNLLQSYIYTKA